MLQVTAQSAIGIQTKFLAPNNKGSRIKAFTLDKNPTTERPDSLILPRDYRLSDAEIHQPAMLELHNKLNHNPDTEWQEKECNHVAVSSGTSTGYIYIFRNKE